MERPRSIGKLKTPRKMESEHMDHGLFGEVGMARARLIKITTLLW